MVLRVECACGKSYQVPDEAAGKRIKCPSCGQALAVPSPPAAEPPTEDAACPHCGAALRAGAGFCTACGANLRTGAAHEPSAPPAHALARPRPSIVLPWGRIIGVAALLAAVTVVWFGMLRPMRARLAIDDAMKPTAEGKYDSAIKMLQAAQGRLYGPYAEEAGYRIAQLQLEQRFVTMDDSPDGGMLQMGAEPQLADNGQLLLHLTVLNASDKPIALQRQAFYLSSSVGIVPNVAHGEGSVEGVVVAPGATRAAMVAFWKLPGSPLGLITPEIAKPQKLVYNDGKLYSSTFVFLMGIGGPPDEEELPLP
jgi:hypothetical protein